MIETSEQHLSQQLLLLASFVFVIVIVIVIVFVFVFAFVFVIVFFLVSSCFLITLITCLKGHKSLRVLYSSVFQQCVVVSESVSDKVNYRAVWGQLKKSGISLHGLLYARKPNDVICLAVYQHPDAYQLDD